MEYIIREKCLGNKSLSMDFIHLVLRRNFVDSSFNFNIPKDLMVNSVNIEKTIGISNLNNDFSKREINRKSDSPFEIDSFVTKDKDFLKDYYKIRHESYNRDNGWDDYDGSKNEYDDKGIIAVALNKKNEIIGGARLIMSNAVDNFPNEEDDKEYSYKNLVEKLGFDRDCLFGEISSFAVKSDYRDRKVTGSILSVLVDKAVSSGCVLVMGIAGAVVCRDYRIALNSLGYKFKIATNVPWIKSKKYGYIQPYPIFSGFNENSTNERPA